MSRKYRQRKQLITSLIENFDWETNPNWQIEMMAIDEKIKEFWTKELKRPFKKQYGE